MARKKRSSSRRRGPQRGYQYQLKPKQVLRPPLTRRKEERLSRDPIVVDDRRYWRPDEVPKNIDGTEAKIVLAKRKKNYRPYSSLGAVRSAFREPWKVVLCRRRRRRRRILFSLRRIGRGRGGGFRLRKMTPWSHIRC